MSAIAPIATETVTRSETPLCANGDLMRRSKRGLFDHLVGAAEQWQRHADAERLGSLEIEEHLDFRGLLNRQLADLFAFENTPGIDASQAIRLGNGAAIAHQAASGDEPAGFEDR